MNDPDFEKLLSSTLHEDANTDPLTGLDQRIMARIQAEPASRSSWRFLVWGVPTAALAAALVALALWPHQVIPVKPPAPEAATQRPTPTPDPLPPSLALQSRVTQPPAPNMTAAVATQPEALPKLDVFPTPSPLPESLREFAALPHSDDTSSKDAEHTPPAELKIDPITIAQIEIAPLYPLTAPKGEQPLDNKGENR